jgi:TonB-dependent SusC/RagA subfamily outer membrane receptor
MRLPITGMLLVTQQLKKDVTGAITSINQKDIKSRPVDNALQAMQGKVAGVDIGSNERPGTIPSINIRGVRSLTASNTPLFVVDGIPLITGSIDNINPQDIESIDVLKDASATAIYGSRGANGVVIITTKQAKAGKVTLSLNSSFTLDELVDNTESLMPVILLFVVGHIIMRG